MLYISSQNHWEHPTGLEITVEEHASIVSHCAGSVQLGDELFLQHTAHFDLNWARIVKLLFLTV